MKRLPAHWSSTRKTMTRSTLRTKPTPKRTKKLTIKRKTEMKLKKLKYWLTTKSKSSSTVKRIGHRLRNSSGSTVRRLHSLKSQAVSQQRKQAEDALQKAMHPASNAWSSGGTV